MSSPTEFGRPWRVVVVGEGGFLAGGETKEQADVRCAEANAKAEALGIKARYEVVAKP